MAETMNAELLADVKRVLNITWADEDTDRKLVSIIDNAVYYINSKLGTSADIIHAGYPRMLLMEYCRYAWNEALDAFETNYQSLILSMQFDRQVVTADETTA